MSNTLKLAVAFSILSLSNIAAADATVFHGTISGDLTGVGTFAVSGDTGIGTEAFSPPGYVNHDPMDPRLLTALDIHVGGFEFKLADAAASYAVLFTQDGSPVGLNFYSFLFPNDIPGRNLLANLSIQGKDVTLIDYSNASQMSYRGTLEFDAVPEPLTITLFSAGLIGLVALRRHKKSMPLDKFAER